MGNWRKDQSKNARRMVWGQTRGEFDPTRQDFVKRMKEYPAFASLRIEKIGGEIHCWRQVSEPESDPYWFSCIRFVGDGWGYWKLFYRKDESRWRPTSIKELPAREVIAQCAEFYTDVFHQKA